MSEDTRDTVEGTRTPTEAVRSLFDLVDPRTLPLRHRLGVLGLLAIGLAPFWFRLFWGRGKTILNTITLTSALFFAMFALSWDLVSGYTGQISFGHALFFAVGGYTSAILNLQFGLPPALTVVAGTALAAVAGLLIGVPALRLKGPYLSLVTLIAPLILHRLFIVFSGTFGGELGLPTPDPLVAVGSFRRQVMANFYVAFVLFVLLLAVALAVTRSDAGSVFTAIREDEKAVAASGLNPAKFKIFAFVLSAAIGGLAGAMFVHTVGKPSPSQLLELTVSIEVIIAAILGGMGTIVGAAAGGLFFFLFRKWLGGIQSTVVGVQIGSLDLFIVSIVTVLLLFFLPGGLVRWAIHLGRRVLDFGRRVVARFRGGIDERIRADGGQTPLERTIESYREDLDDITGGDDDEYRN